MRGIGRLVLVGALVLTACTSDSKPAASGSSASSTPPQHATLALELPDGPVAIGSPQVNCFFPTVDGQQIAVLAFSPDQTQTYRIGVASDGVVVRHGTGSGDEYKERVFRGPGVAQFDATRGATFDAPLTEGGDPAVVGSLKGSIDCAGQTPGTSTITLTGDTVAGHLDHARLEPALVECYRSASEVIVLGVADTGTKKVHLLVSLTPQGLGVEEEVPPSRQVHYQGRLSSATLNGNGGSANGDVTEQGSHMALVNPRMLHVEGEATCGTPVLE